MAELKGVSEVLKNLNKAISDIENKTKAGLTEACLVVKVDSVKGTPIDLGNLRSSAFIMVTDSTADNSSPNFTGKDAGEMQSNHSKALNEGKGITRTVKNKFVGIIAYTANYAFWVHEMPMIHKGEPRAILKNRGNFWDGGGNKFLEKSLLKNKERISRILQKWAKI